MTCSEAVRIARKTLYEHRGEAGACEAYDTLARLHLFLDVAFREARA